MNYLGHAYLSFNQPEVLVGNIISDFVKGKKKFDYSPGIQKGITLHRLIDEFTDNHPATQTAKQFFKPAYRLYSGAFSDVVYDHFLACDYNEFPGNNSLQRFTLEVYAVLQEHNSFLPSRFQIMLPYMQLQNWLLNYQYRWGIEKSFGGLVRRALYMNESATAFDIFNKYYNELERCYKEFFPDVKKFSADQLRNLLRH